MVNITTGAADAEQGMAGSSAITVITKSGTNDIHGSAFEFHDDQHLNARNFFQAGRDRQAAEHLQQFRRHHRRPHQEEQAVLLPELRRHAAAAGFAGLLLGADRRFQRVGDFSAYSTVIYDPKTGNPDGTGRTPFAGNKIPTDRLDPIAQKLQSYYPLPNVRGREPIREQLLRLRRADPEPQLLRREDQLHRQRQDSRSGASTAACGPPPAVRPSSASQ